MHQCRLRMLMSGIEVLCLQSSTYIKKHCEMGNTVSVSCPQVKLTSEQFQNTPRNKRIVTQLPNVIITYSMMMFRCTLDFGCHSEWERKNKTMKCFITDMINRPQKICFPIDQSSSPSRKKSAKTSIIYYYSQERLLKLFLCLKFVTKVLRLKLIPTRTTNSAKDLTRTSWEVHLKMIIDALKQC